MLNDKFYASVSDLTSLLCSDSSSNLYNTITISAISYDSHPLKIKTDIEKFNKRIASVCCHKFNISCYVTIQLLTFIHATVPISN